MVAAIKTIAALLAIVAAVAVPPHGHSDAMRPPRAPVPTITLHVGQPEPDCGVMVDWIETNTEDDRGYC